ncbi:UBP-type zinc finger domain-containing protein [Nakamurella aerolata]|uniref:UBP-type zinc finger domain-containing protein n=1 Tax=Nakamurella aerolata TaxID=1656892 RepID=A0A849AG48_9ACTN|nr:UBP-type zinc finger domain-containing protein [Nakamurella aerolata]NNG37430.1 UBP-type zinc finger domain-containing protein [Nakamurella aerolata]
MADQRDTSTSSDADTQAINPSVPPSGPGCVECDESGSWWVHLRRCAACGHVGCCDSSPNKHATAHYRETGHPVIASYEPGEDWFYDYRTEELTEGVPLAPPESHPEDQSVPGPADRVPPNWRDYL